MENIETIMGISAIHISLASAFVSFFSFMVAGYLAWKTKFSPPRFVGEFPYAIIWSFDGGDPNKVGDEFIIPYIWLSNIGARPFLVGDIRLSIYKTNNTKYEINPTHSVPLTAIESPNLFSEFELIRTGKSPFNGFSVSGSEQWKNIYAFKITTEERAYLNGSVKLKFEIRRLGSKKFKSILSETISFEKKDEEVDWVRWLGQGGPKSIYYYKVQ